MLDNVIDINYYTVPQARRSNLQHRPIGLGIMGFQDALYEQRIPYSSNEAVEFADRSMEVISYHAIRSSCDLAEERGTYASYEGSLWSKGILPIDSIELLQASRGQYLEQDTSSTLDWNRIRTRVATKACAIQTSWQLLPLPLFLISAASLNRLSRPIRTYLLNRICQANLLSLIHT